MTRRLALIAATALALGGCGGESATTTSTTTATSTAASLPIQTFFYRDAALVAVTTRIPETPAPATAALLQLLEGAPAGYETTIPTGVELEAVAIADGMATARFSSDLGVPARTAQAQIVSTLMQFSTVRGVTIEVAGKGAVPLENGAGRSVAPASDADYVDLTAEAPIFVRTPARDSTVSSPVHASGTADVFEATFQVEIRSGAKLLDSKTITATSGTGTRGTWEATLDLPPGEVTLAFYEPSAKDGSHLHETQVHVRVE